MLGFRESITASPPARERLLNWALGHAFRVSHARSALARTGISMAYVKRTVLVHIAAALDVAGVDTQLNGKAIAAAITQHFGTSKDAA